MQTFLPYRSFGKTAECLDYRRLGKQRVEAKQIYLALTKKEYGWKNHPAVKMWKGYEPALLFYGAVMCTVWSSYGYKDSLFEFFKDEFQKNKFSFRTIKFPPWINSRKLHQSHRSNLIRKDEKHYRKYFPKVKNDIPYYWPVK